MFNGNCSELSNGYITASKINKVIRKYGTWDTVQEFECIKYGICFTEQQKKVRYINSKHGQIKPVLTNRFAEL